MGGCREEREREREEEMGMAQESSKGWVGPLSGLGSGRAGPEPLSRLGSVWSRSNECLSPTRKLNGLYY